MKLRGETFLLAALLSGCAATTMEPDATVATAPRFQRLGIGDVVAPHPGMTVAPRPRTTSLRRLGVGDVAPVVARERGQMLEVVVDDWLPLPRIHARDHQGGKRALHAAGGALGGAGFSLYAGCMALPVLGCIFGAALAPVGALVGAVVQGAKVDSIDSYHEPDAAPGAGRLFAVAREAEVPATLRRAVLAQQLDGGGHLNLKVRAFELSGEIGADANVALVVTVDATLRRPHAADLHGTYAYISAPQRMSAWNAGHAQLFRQHIVVAMGDIAAQLAQDIGVRATRSA